MRSERGSPLEKDPTEVYPQQGRGPSTPARDHRKTFSSGAPWKPKVFRLALEQPRRRNPMEGPLHGVRGRRTGGRGKGVGVAARPRIGGVSSWSDRKGEAPPG